MVIEPEHFRVAPSSGLPIFRQIIDQVNAMIASGTLSPGDMLPSTRELARALEVNMMTVSKAYSRLEADAVVERVRGTGMRIAPRSINRSLADRKQEFQELVAPALHRARHLGLTEEQILTGGQKMLKANTHGS